MTMPKAILAAGLLTAAALLIGPALRGVAQTPAVDPGLPAYVANERSARPSFFVIYPTTKAVLLCEADTGGALLPPADNKTRMSRRPPKPTEPRFTCEALGNHP